MITRQLIKIQKSLKGQSLSQRIAIPLEMKMPVMNMGINVNGSQTRANKICHHATNMQRNPLVNILPHQKCPRYLINANGLHTNVKPNLNFKEIEKLMSAKTFHRRNAMMLTPVLLKTWISVLTLNRIILWRKRLETRMKMQILMSLKKSLRNWMKMKY